MSEIPTGSDLIARDDVINTIKETAQYHTGDSFNADRLIRYIKELNNQPLITGVLPAEPKVEASGINEIVKKIRAEISKAWYTQPKNRYEEGLKDQALNDMKIIDKYKDKSESEE